MHLGLFQNIQWPETTDQRGQFDNAIEQTLLAEQLGLRLRLLRRAPLDAPRHPVFDAGACSATWRRGRRRIRLGTAVLVLPFHDPARLVEEAATVDLLSNGRLELGVGRGFQWTEFNGFGLSLDDSTARYDEALEIILKAWRDAGALLLRTAASGATTTSRWNRSRCRSRIRRSGPRPAARNRRRRSDAWA